MHEFSVTGPLTATRRGSVFALLPPVCVLIGSGFILLTAFGGHDDKAANLAWKAIFIVVGVCLNFAGYIGLLSYLRTQVMLDRQGLHGTNFRGATVTIAKNEITPQSITTRRVYSSYSSQMTYVVNASGRKIAWDETFKGGAELFSAVQAVADAMVGASGS